MKKKTKNTIKAMAAVSMIAAVVLPGVAACGTKTEGQQSLIKPPTQSTVVEKNKNYSSDLMKSVDKLFDSEGVMMVRDYKDDGDALYFSEVYAISGNQFGYNSQQHDGTKERNISKQFYVACENGKQQGVQIDGDYKYVDDYSFAIDFSSVDVQAASKAGIKTHISDNVTEFNNGVYSYTIQGSSSDAYAKYNVIVDNNGNISKIDRTWMYNNRATSTESYTFSTMTKKEFNANYNDLLDHIIDYKNQSTLSL